MHTSLFSYSRLFQSQNLSNTCQSFYLLSSYLLNSIYLLASCLSLLETHKQRGKSGAGAHPPPHQLSVSGHGAFEGLITSAGMKGSPQERSIDTGSECYHCLDGQALQDEEVGASKRVSHPSPLPRQPALGAASSPATAAFQFSDLLTKDLTKQIPCPQS